MDTKNMPNDALEKGKQRIKCQISTSLHKDQSANVVAVDMAAPMAPYFGINHRFNSIFSMAAIRPLIKVRVECPDMGMSRIAIEQETQINCPPISMSKDV